MRNVPVQPISLLRSAVRLLSRIPAGVQQPCASNLLNLALHQQLDDGELDFLTGKVFRITLTDIPKSWFITLKNKRLVVLLTGKEDACISGKLESFLALASQQIDPDTLFFQRKLSISGDTELGLYVKNLLDSLELDALPTLFARPLQYYGKHFTPREA
ncbi:SCP2 sterol-binding domain-containing protein [Lacimicrobium sp. SS2-24]|uniref:ubiquinone anaerobic biosynthesis accessory factor UbiT n=1 Tax=Lacimicrobium sp. SS2-24 TaxID=2005569 RepID=UPI000B4AABE2|nr:SCP2 sterol-binding domain-containing protein [Lacimicrobium sp. SS2-24]